MERYSAGVIKSPRGRCEKFTGETPFYYGVVIRTEIITSVAYTIIRHLGAPPANYETPNSAREGKRDTERGRESKLWSVR